MSQPEMPDRDQESIAETHDTPQTGVNTAATFQIAGFWRRGFAGMLDMLLLGIPLTVVAFPLRSYAYLLGPWGRLIGLVVGVAYFGILNSRLRGGQTLAKRWLRLAVVDKDGNHLSVRRSLARAAILMLIPLMNGWSIPLIQKVPAAIAVQGFIVFGGGLVFTYTMIFNRKTRQGPHDLLVGSYVVAGPPDPGATAPARPPIHRWIVLGILGLTAILMMGILIFDSMGIMERTDLQAPGELGEALELYEILSADNRFFSVSVNSRSTHHLGSSEVYTSLDIQAWYKGTCTYQGTECVEVVRDIAEVAFAEYSGIEQFSGMSIRVESRYDLGLATFRMHHTITLPIDEWPEFLDEPVGSL